MEKKAFRRPTASVRPGYPVFKLLGRTLASGTMIVMLSGCWMMQGDVPGPPAPADLQGEAIDGGPQGDGHPDNGATDALPTSDSVQE